MTKVLVSQSKLDTLAEIVGGKSNTNVPLTVDEMITAADSITSGGGSPTLETVAKTYTPSTSAVTDTITPSSGYDGIEEVDVTVSAVPSAYVYPNYYANYITQNNVRKWWVEPNTYVDVAGWVNDGDHVGNKVYYNAIAKNTTVTPSTSSQTIGGENYMMEDAVTVSAMPSGSVTAPASISGTAATVSTGTNTLTLSKTVSVTPNVTAAGYISSGTAGNSSVSLTANVTTKAAATITPSTSNQTISSGTYLTGTQTISGDANLVAGNIKSGTSIFGVTGTYSGGGGVSGVAKGTLTVSSNVNTSTNTKITDTTTIGFTPKCFLFYRSDRSATSNHVNQASFVTLGSSYYVRTMTRYSSNALSTSGNTNNWTTQTSGYLYFNSNNIYFRSSSSYILPSGTWYWVAIQ